MTLFSISFQVPFWVDTILGLYRDNGKENGDYHIIIGYSSILESIKTRDCTEISESQDKIP